MSSIKWGEWSANGHWVCALFMKWTKIFSGEKNSFETTAISRKKEEHLPNSVIKLRGNLLGQQQQQQGPIERDPFTARPILNPLNISTLIRTFVFRTDNCQPIRKTFIILSENVLCLASINMPIFNEGQFVPSFFPVSHLMGKKPFKANISVLFHLHSGRTFDIYRYWNRSAPKTSWSQNPTVPGTIINYNQPFVFLSWFWMEK